MTRALLTVAVVAAVLVVLLRPHDDAGSVPSLEPAGGPSAPAVAAGADVPTTAEPAVVASITDGDTLRVDLDGRDEAVRLLQLDAPEADGTCGAARATAALAALAPVGTTVWLEADVEGRDRYGRLLRYLWRADGTMVNRALVRRGWARAKLYPPNDRHWTTMRRAGERAERRAVGLWRRCGWISAAGPRP